MPEHSAVAPTFATSKARLRLFLPLLLAVLASCASGAETVRVSQPLALTNGSFYERGQSVVFDGAYYWLFYTRSASIAQPFQEQSHPLNDYDLFCRRAQSVPELAAATEIRVGDYPAGSANVTLGRTAAAYHDGRIWVFAALDEDNEPSGSQSRLFAWATADGETWIQSERLGIDVYAGDEQFAFDVHEFGGMLWLVTADGDFYTQYATNDPLTESSWSGLIPVGLDEELSDGTASFFDNGTDLFLSVYSANPDHRLYLYRFDTGASSWVKLSDRFFENVEPAVLFYRANYTLYLDEPLVDGGGMRRIVSLTHPCIECVLFEASPAPVSEGRWGEQTWIDGRPRAIADGGQVFLFFTSERNGTGPETIGHIWYLNASWNFATPHYTFVRQAVSAAGQGDTVNVSAGSYHETVNVTSGIFLSGSPGASPYGPGADAPALSGQMVLWNATNASISGFRFSVGKDFGRPVAAITSAGCVACSNLQVSNNSFSFAWDESVSSPGTSLELFNISGNSSLSSNSFELFAAAGAVFDPQASNSSLTFVRIDGSLSGNWNVTANNASDQLNDSDAFFLLVGNGTAGTLAGATSVLADSNLVSGFGGFGVLSSQPAGTELRVFNNSFSFRDFSSGTGVSALASVGAFVNASGNWWGSNDGPNWTARSFVSGNVSFSPWCADAICASTLSDGPDPLLELFSPNDGGAYVSPVQISFGSWDSGSGLSGCSYSLDGATNASLESCANSSVAIVGYGRHSLWLYAIDRAGNINSSFASFYIQALSPPPSGGHVANVFVPADLPAGVPSESPQAPTPSPAAQPFTPVAPDAGADGAATGTLRAEPDYIFDIVVSMVEKRVLRGQVPTAKVSLTKFGESGIAPVKVSYTVTHESGKVVLEEEEPIDVNVHDEHLRSFLLPPGSPVGNYKIRGRVTYREGLFAESEDSFYYSGEAASAGFFPSWLAAFAAASVALAAGVLAYRRLSRASPQAKTAGGAPSGAATSRRVLAVRKRHLLAIRKEILAKAGKR